MKKETEVLVMADELASVGKPMNTQGHNNAETQTEKSRKKKKKLQKNFWKKFRT